LTKLQIEVINLQTIYIGETKKVGDVDLKKYRVYTERPTEIIEKLKQLGEKLVEKKFIAVDKFAGLK